MIERAGSSSHCSPLAEGGDLARLVVCETTGQWAVALRRELAGRGLSVHQTRSIAQAWEMLARFPASFLVVELTRASVEPLLERLAWAERDYPLARVAVVAQRALDGCEWLVREAGAVHFTTSPRQLAGVAHMACQHVQNAPRLPRSITDDIWARLPWGEQH